MKTLLFLIPFFLTVAVKAGVEVAGAGSSGGVTIGTPVTGGTADQILYTDDSGDIAGSSSLTWDATTGLNVVNPSTFTGTMSVTGAVSVSSLTVTNTVRGATTNYRRYYHVATGSFDPGASGATWSSSDGNVLCGWQLDAAGETLETGTDVHSDWDGASDLTLEVVFTVNASTSAAEDTVDIKAVFYYKGVGDTATKTQTVEEAVTVGGGTQYSQFKQEFTIDFDAVDNVVEAGDQICVILNLETDTSEVDNIIINGVSFYYPTTHVGIEDGDI